MPNYTPNLNLEKPLQTETYNIAVHNANSDKIDAASNEHRTAAVLDHPNGSVTEPKLAPEAVSTRALSKTGVAAGTYKSVTVDVKGRVTGGTNPTTLAGYGITDAYKKTESDTRYLPIRGKAVDAEKADGVTVTNLGNFKGKTIGELKTALKNWLISSDSAVKTCRFGGVSTNSILNWDLENTIITDGIVWTATTIAANSYKTYNRILISSYATPLFVAILSSGEWLKLLEIPLKNNLISSINGVSTVNGGAVNIPNATQSQSGVMSAADKTKLDGIEANANKYTLPPAGASVLGGIKVGANLGISNGVLSGAYATATTSAPGLLRRLSGNANDVMTGTGVWSSNNSITAQSLRTNGYVKFGNGFIIQWGITAKATLSVTFPIPFPNNLLSIVQGDLYSDRGDRMTYDEKRINTRTNTGFTYNSASCERAWVAIGY